MENVWIYNVTKRRCASSFAIVFDKADGSSDMVRILPQPMNRRKLLSFLCEMKEIFTARRAGMKSEIQRPYTVCTYKIQMRGRLQRNREQSTEYRVQSTEYRVQRLQATGGDIKTGITYVFHIFLFLYNL